jgi:DNA invertase Pin-like site-specific DNA recombinase
MHIARLYLRVSSDEQDLTRQAHIEQSTRSAGLSNVNYIGGISKVKFG